MMTPRSSRRGPYIDPKVEALLLETEEKRRACVASGGHYWGEPQPPTFELARTAGVYISHCICGLTRWVPQP